MHVTCQSGNRSHFDTLRAQAEKKERDRLMGKPTAKSLEYPEKDIREYSSEDLRTYLEMTNRLYHPYEGVINANADDYKEILSWFDVSYKQSRIFADAFTGATSPEEKEKYEKLHDRTSKAHDKLFDDFGDLHASSVKKLNENIDTDRNTQ